MNLNFSKRILNFAKCVHVTCIRQQSAQANLMANMLGINNDQAQEFVKKNQLDRLDTIRFAETLKFVTTYNLNIDEALEHPRLFNFNGRRLEYTYMYFKECGCTNVCITDLINCQKIRAFTIKQLKEHKFLPKNVNVAERLVGYLNPMPENFDISDLQDEDLPLCKIHTKIVNRYLKLRLEATDEEVEKLARIHSSVYNKNLAYLCENINLALDLGYTKRKILRNAYIMSVWPKITKEVLGTIPQFAGTDMAVQLRRYPKLIGISVHDILRIYEILKNENIPDEMIKRSMNIFTLSPKTIKLRLNDIKSTPETRVLMHNPNMLDLIIHYHSAKDRLHFLQKIKLRCASLLVIGVQGENFENHIKEGKDVNPISEIDRFLRMLVNVNEKVELDYRKHPYYLYVPLVDIEDTYYFLKGKLFTNAHIAKVIPILLYPKDKILSVLEKIKSDESVQKRPKRMSRVQILNMALYLLERDHHFSGNGIWRNNFDNELL